MHIPILIEVQNERECHRKDKALFLKLLFRDEGHLYANCLFCMPTIYPKFHSFHFFSRGMRMYVPILTGAQTGRISRRKNSHVLLKTFF